MKHNTLILIGAGLLAATSFTHAGFANAAGQLAPVQVHGTAVDCTPPNDNAVCSAWHEQIRRNFSSREIGMLFGARTAYPEYLTSYGKVEARYNAMQAEFATTHAAELDTIASK
jgi:hypothetical protein